MDRPADFKLEQREDGQTAVLTGEWTAVRMGWANERLEEALKGTRGVTLDLNGIDRCDTSGAYGILKAGEKAAEPGKTLARPEIAQLLELVANAIEAPPTPQHPQRSFYDLFDRIGRGVVDLGLSIYEFNVFNGHLIVAVGRAIA